MLVNEIGLIGETLTSFHTSGTIPDFSEELKILVTVGVRSQAKSLHNQ